ncbi:MAG: ATP-binding cassette domain-containing protein [Neisseriaceae bacterium]
MHTSSHSPILIKDLAINFGNKSCITNPFSSTVYFGERIALIGSNGSGKSSLLRVMALLTSDFEGEIVFPDNINLGYIPQIGIENNSKLSGGQTFNQKLSQIIANKPNLLLLDEPTNHLDYNNRKGLFGFLNRYCGTLIVVTHDVELLNCFDTIWHIFNDGINIFNGKYLDYMTKQQQEFNKLNSDVKQLKREKKQIHEKLMLEQQRIKNKTIYGEKKYNGDTLALRSAQGRGQATANKNNARINQNKNSASAKLQELYIPEVIVPKFNLRANNVSFNKTVVSITDGKIGYMDNDFILENINLQIMATEKIAVLGNNGSGKSTFVKAIMSHKSVVKEGNWYLPDINDIGYIDQHYANLCRDSTAVQLLQELVPQWSYAEIRNHLNVFLFRKDEEVNTTVRYLSGGERVRLSLALVAAKMPKLLLLDEITNNIDLETKEHLSQVLAKYSGAMIIICHEQSFIEKLQINSYYHIKDNKLHG